MLNSKVIGLLAILVSFTAVRADYLPDYIVIRTTEKITVVSKSADKILVTSDPDLNQLCTKHQIWSIQPLFIGPAEAFQKPKGEELKHWFIIRMRGNQNLDSAIRALTELPWVTKAEKSMNLPLSATYPDDISFPDQWGLNQSQDHDIDAPEAWDIEQGNDVVLGIIDSGVDWQHPDLGGSAPYEAGNIWINEIEANGTDFVDDDGNGYVDDVRGWDWVDGIVDYYPGEDFTGEDNNPMDFQGHGTHVAGIAGAIGNNGIGVSGVCWNAKLMPLRVGWATSTGSGVVNMSFCAQAIFYATYKGATAVNCSWGSSNAGGFGVAVDYAIANGVLVVVAAGNDGTSSQSANYLSTRGDCIDVANVDSFDVRQADSNYGPWVDVSAPGTEILSTIPVSHNPTNPYGLKTGTSMSAPFVTGLAGMIKSKYPNWDSEVIRQHIINTTDFIDDLNPGHENDLGSGRINAFSAVFNGTIVNSNITSSQIWTLEQSPYTVTSEVVIYNGATVTIEPGVNVKFESCAGLRIGGSSGTNQAGSLIAVATPENPVRFTSLSGNPGNWTGLLFDTGSDYSSAYSELQNCIIENAGQANAYGEGANIQCRFTDAPEMSACSLRHSTDNELSLIGGSPTILNTSIIGDNGYSVVYMEGNSDPVIDGCHITGNGGYAWVNSVSVDADPVISGTIFDGSVQNAIRVGRYFRMWDNTLTGATNAVIEVYGGTITTDRTWQPQNTDLPYRVLGDIVIYNGAVLTIEPSTCVQFSSGAELRIGLSESTSQAGGILAVGTTEDPILFTSAEGIPGTWRGITFETGSDYGSAYSELQYCTIEYAGEANTYSVGSNLYCRSTIYPIMSACTLRHSSDNELIAIAASPSLYNCRIESSNGYSIIYMDGDSDPIIDGCHITGNGNYAWLNSISPDADPVISNSTFDGSVQNAIRLGRYFQMWDNTLTGAENAVIEVYGGSLTSSRIWRLQNTNLPYRILGDMLVYNNATLSIEAGCILQFDEGADLRIGNDSGTSQGGSLNAIGNQQEPIIFTGSLSSPGSWGGLIFDTGSDYSGAASQLQYCVIENAGQTNLYSNSGVYARYTNSITLRHCTVRNSTGTAGVQLVDADITLLNCAIIDNDGNGITCASNSNPNLGSSRTEANDIYGNGSHGIEIEGSGDVSAVYEYWGTTSESLIQNVIYDSEDNPALGTVFYQPWTDQSHTLTFPDPGAYSVLQALPAEIDEWLTSGNQSVQTLWVKNLSDVIVAADISESIAWVSLSTTSEIIAAGDSAMIAVTINAASLASGQYTGYLTISCDHPEQPAFAVPVLLNVLSSQAEPQILSVLDVPNDQGRQVRVRWSRSEADNQGTPVVEEYSVWRRVDNAPVSETNQRPQGSALDFEGDWDYIGIVPALGLDTYNYVAPTVADSNQAGTNYSVFAILAHTDISGVYYESSADSGYSIDNLAPSAPLLAGLNAGNDILLEWSTAIEEDFNYYLIYRTTEPVNPDTITQAYATTIDTAYTDSDTAPGTYYYFVRAVDFNGNTSDASNTVTITSGSLQAPTALTIKVDSPETGTLRWLPVPGAGYYEIYELTTSDGPESLLGTTTGSNFTVALPGTHRFYTVRAISN